MALSVNESLGKAFYIELINLLTIAKAEAIVAGTDSVNTALTTLGTERDKQ